jgi:hypothetical protein
MAGTTGTTNGTFNAGNGRKLRLLTRDAIDGRSKAARLFDDIATGIASDLGGEDRLSTVEKHLIEAYAGIAVHVHSANARLLLGQPVDLAEHSQAASTLCRLASRIGTKRIPKDVPSLESYISSRYGTRTNGLDEARTREQAP